MSLTRFEAPSLKDKLEAQEKNLKAEKPKNLKVEKKIKKLKGKK